MAEQPAKHGRDHRPPGWLGVADPGGADPMHWLTQATAQWSRTVNKTFNNATLTALLDTDSPGVSTEPDVIEADIIGDFTLLQPGVYDLFWWGLFTTTVTGTCYWTVTTGGTPSRIYPNVAQILIVNHIPTDGDPTRTEVSCAGRCIVTHDQGTTDPIAGAYFYNNSGAARTLDTAFGVCTFVHAL